MSGTGIIFSVLLAGRTWWSKKGFALELEKPDGFQFLPGQSVQIMYAAQGRDYSLSSAPTDARLEVCLRLVESGRVSRWLASAPVGTPILFGGPNGLFVFRPSPRPAVLVATGTGFAPFLSMVRTGLRDFTFLHGVRSEDELCEEDVFREAAELYVPCLSAAGGGRTGSVDSFPGRVTDWIRRHLRAGSYDFYLCGGREMVRDVTGIVDERFPDSRVYTEIFY